MEKLSIEEVVEIVEKLDRKLKELGWKREDTLEVSYRIKIYRATIGVYTPDDEEEDEDDD